MPQITIHHNQDGLTIHLPNFLVSPDGSKRLKVITIDRSCELPAAASWDAWFDGPNATDDFLTERGQPINPHK